MARQIDWAAIRAAWEAGATVVAICKQFRVDPTSVRRRKREEFWSRGEAGTPAGSESQPSSSASNLISFPGGRAPSVPRLTVEIPDDVTDEHLADGLRALAAKVTAELLADLITPGQNQSKADVYKNGAEVIVKAIAASRDVAGKKPGTPSVAPDSDDESRVEEVVLIVRERADAQAS